LANVRIVDMNNLYGSDSVRHRQILFDIIKIQ